MKRINPRSGMVLVVVLWTLALLSALAMAAATTFRSFAGIMVVDQGRVQAQALLTAGAEIAAGHLANLDKLPLMPADLSVTLRAGTLRIRMTDEGGRIDINKAPVELLDSLFQYAGAKPDVAIAMTDWIEAQRKQRRTPAVGIAAAQLAPLMQRGQNSTGPTAAGPNWPFTDPRQLIQIPGMQQQWVNTLLPLVTVFGNKTVNLFTAPASVIAVLPGVSPPAVQSFLQARAQSFDDVERLRSLLGQAASKFLDAPPAHVAKVMLEAQVKNGVSAAAEATIVVLAGDREPYRILDWNPIVYDR